MFRSGAVYWVWLTQALGYNSPKFKKINEMYKSIESFYNDGSSQWLISGIFSSPELTALENTPLSDAEKILQKCDALGYRLLTIDDPAYPHKLMEIYSPPAVLYISGNLPDFNTLAISIVGTRRASAYGIKSAYEIAYNLAKEGVIIVSGGALGVDSSAHSGAIHARGTTVSVLGCGINSSYLMQNANLRKTIAATGALISEYPPDSPVKSYNFPARNRIIAALCNGVLVIEAGNKSGSLITANLALEQGRDVFAVMANITSEESKGSNRLIKEGAIPVTEYDDILDYYFFNYKKGERSPKKMDADLISKIPSKGKSTFGFSSYQQKQGLLQKPNSGSKKQEQTHLKPFSQKPVFAVHKQNLELTPNADTVYKTLSGEPMHIDDIVSNTGLAVLMVLQALTELELLGVIESVKGRKYKLV
ncbi:MAG: DNA-processing protein DprA [Oscillospiraceae bacterium]|jgi:DNA processing protein|nr:DNA-processing protein DprA [Oscillospiraceae bacterium]